MKNLLEVSRKHQQLWHHRWIRTMMYAIAIILMIILTPRLVLRYYESKGYAFKDNVGYISQYAYQKHITEPNLDASFEKEIPIYLDYISISNKNYDIVFSSNTIFDIGMFTDYFSVGLIHFYAFEFLHGNPFSSDDQIVLSESISIALFNKVDSVNETIVINDLTYTVSGVVKEASKDMNYIYMSMANIETVTGRETTYFTFILFEDQNLLAKLYDRGGSKLVFSTITIHNQNTYNATVKLMINIGFVLIASVMMLVDFKFKTNKKGNDENTRSSTSKNFLVYLTKSYIYITIGIIYMAFTYSLLMATQTSFSFGYKYVLSMAPKFYGVLVVYMIPVIFEIVKRFKHRTVN